LHVFPGVPIQSKPNPPISEPFPITPHDSIHAGHFSQNNKSEGSFAPPTSRQPLDYVWHWLRAAAHTFILRFLSRS